MNTHYQFDFTQTEYNVYKYDKLQYQMNSLGLYDIKFNIGEYQLYFRDAIYQFNIISLKNSSLKDFVFFYSAKNKIVPICELRSYHYYHINLINSDVLRIESFTQARLAQIEKITNV